jgi:hypothetical protein
MCVSLRIELEVVSWDDTTWCHGATPTFGIFWRKSASFLRIALCRLFRLKNLSPLSLSHFGGYFVSERKIAQEQAEVDLAAHLTIMGEAAIW